MGQTDDIKFIHRHLTGDSTTMEGSDYAEWKNREVNNKVLAEQIETIWKAAVHTNELFFDANKAFNKHLASIIKEKSANEAPPTKNITVEQKQNTHSRLHIFYNTWARAVAAILVLVTVALFVFNQKNVTHLSTEDQVLTLSDGSKVWLQKGSVLNTNSFSPNNRNVRLKGKGYFEIKSNMEAPFKIDAEDFDVQVLGTKFVVDAMNKEINVKEGKVKISTDKENVILVANQRATLNKGDMILVDNTIFDDNQLWFNDILAFNNTPFDQVIKVISENYNVKITLPNRNDWTNCTFTSGSLKGNTLDQVLVILKLTYELEYTHTKDNNIILSKVKCK